MCSAPSLRNTAPNEPMKELTRIRTTAVLMCGMGVLLLHPQHGDAPDDECNPDASEKVQMFVGQEKQREDSDPDISKGNDRVKARQFPAFQSQGHQEGIDPIQAIA